MRKGPLVMIIAGEASGDHHGARVVGQMRNLDKSIRFCGIGGQAMARAGVRLVMDAADMAVVGITEVFAKIPQLLKGRRLARGLLSRLKPDLLILIDFPEFNLHTAAYAKKKGIPVLYYISPQIWAWRRGRVKKIKRRVDHMAVILPFEEVFYREKGVPVTFVGHPLLDRTAPGEPGEPTVLDPLHADADPLTIGLLPGSRSREVSMLLPTMVAAAGVLTESYPEARFIVSRAPTVSVDHMQGVLEECDKKPPFFVVSGERIEDLLNRCHLVVATSGTVALDAALSLTPFIIVYKVSPLSAWLGRRLIRVDHICLVNLIAGRGIVPELIQEEVTAANIVREVKGIITEPGRLTGFKRELEAVGRKLGQPGAAARVASIAMQLIGNRERSVTKTS